MPKCVICGKKYKGYGNNADPVAKGYCCDDCNIDVVVPERLKEIHKMRGSEKKENDTVC